MSQTKEEQVSSLEDPTPPKPGPISGSVVSEPRPEQDPPEAFYFTKEGRTLIHSQPPTAYAWGYPWPPCPTNLAKNKVFRPKEAALPEKVVQEVVQEFRKESKPLSVTEIDGKPLDRSMIPEIELALYWDRHPFEFRPTTGSQDDKNCKRSQSDQNLSQVGGLIVNNCGGSGSPRSSRCSSKDNNIVHNPRRSSSACCSTVTRSSRGSDSKGTHNKDQFHNNNNNHDETVKKIHNNKIPHILQVLNTTEKRKFNDIQPPGSNHFNYKPPNVVRQISDHHRNHNGTLKNQQNKSIGVQVTLDGVIAEAMKSTYLCPLHGQYKRGVDRRSKSGFRTDMATAGSENPHAHCSRGLRSRSRTKLVKTAECQTDQSDGERESRKLVRSKTAPAMRRNINPNMISEQSANFRNPGHISAAENRKLRNKILSYCFTKHSIF
ncbi:uncharacterized protein LOC118437674 [Folsomia candida]|uniref:uncharacterized protein LOC118437674 n=1 Tax=Folsomia candida TaxID=158441 RepID=UPI001604CF69|nr:uncharacterized protein LOC118437674 [Folsomia candida]